MNQLKFKFWVIFLLTGFQCFATIKIHANPPEKHFFVHSFQLLETIGKKALIQYSKIHYSDVTQLTERQKSELIRNSSDATIAILLSEFATGTGPSTRYFFASDPFSKDIITGPGIEWLMIQYLRDSQHIENIRYQFSPKFLTLTAKENGFALSQHFKTLTQGNMSQFVLGSFNASITSNNNQVFVHIWNRTSKKSLFWGMGSKVQRPQMLGTVTQHVYLTISPEQLSEIKNNKK